MNAGSAETGRAAATGSPGIDPVIDSVDLPVLVVDRDVSLARFNAAAAGVLSLSPQDAGRPLRQIPALAQFTTELHDLCEHVIGGIPVLERRVRGPNGSWFLARIVPHLKGDQRAGGAVLTFANVSALQAGIEQAIAEREYAKTILNTVGTPLVVLDDGLKVQTANRAFFALFRISRDETFGLSLCEIAQRQWDLPALRERLEETLSAGKPFDGFEMEAEFPSIGRKTLLLGARPLSKEFEEGPSLLLTIEDITARKQAEADLTQSEQELNDFFENGAVCMHWVAGDGRILRVNQTELDLLGYRREEYVGRHIAEFHVDRDIAEDILRRLRHGETLRAHPARMRCKTGAIRDVLIDSNVLWGSKGEFLHTRCFTRDVTDLRRADEARSRLAAIVDCSDDAIVGQSLDGVINSWNRGAEKTFGYTAAEALGKHIRLIIPQERWPEEDRVLALIRRGEVVDHFETVRQSKGGRRVDISLTVSPIRDAAGNVIGLSKIARDITERRRAAEAVRESEERYRRLVGLLPAAVYTCDAAGAIDFYNEHAALLWGRAPSLGEGCERFCGSFRLWLPDGRALPHDQTPMAVAVREGRGFRNQEVVIEQPDGSRITVLVNIDPIRDGRGAVVGAINVFHDTTALKQAERALRERTAQFETLLNQAPLGVYVVDADFRIRQVNPVARPFFGDIPDLVGRDFAEVIHILWPQDYAEEIVRLFRHTLQTGEPYATPERIEKRLDRGVTEYYEWRIDRIPLPGGRHGVVCYFRDISRQVLARAALEEADRRKDEFIAMLAHELRNPLSALALGVDLLRRAPADDPTIRATVPALVRQTGQLRRLVDDLLDVARATHGKLVLRRQPVELLAAARTVAADFSERSPEAAAIDVGGVETWVDGDPERVQQMLGNLLDNAIKFGGKHIRIRVASDDRGGQIEVRDDGQGIPADLLPVLFEPFVQAEQPLDRGRGGLGLGLALVHRLASLHGGTIAAASGGPGSGSTFVISLPVAARPADGAGRPLYPTAASRRVLVVEDEQDARDVLRALLEGDGHEVCVASNGADGLARFSTFRPEVALVDVGLPGMDGYELARRARALPGGAGLRLIAVTGYGGEHNRARAREAGFDLHVTKPVSYEELIQAFGTTTTT